MKRPLSLLALSALAIAVTRADAAVAVQYTQPIGAPSLPAPLITPLALDVVLCVPQRMHDARIRLSGSARHQNGNLDLGEIANNAGTLRDVGDAATASVQTAFSASFHRVTVVPDCATLAAHPQGSLLVIEPALDYVDVRVDCTLGGARCAVSTVGFTFTLRSLRDGSIVSWQVEGRATRPRHPGDYDYAGELLPNALRSACARTLASLRVNADVKSWLTQNGGGEGVLK